MLSVDTGLIAIFVIVWILVIVLNKVYFRPIGRIVRKRDSEIQQDQNATQEALEKYEKDLTRIEGELASAKIDARETREKFERKAQKEKEKMIAEVSRECRSQVEEAKKELSKKVEQLKKELEPQGQELAEKIEKRLLH